MAQIDKNFCKGLVMRLGEEVRQPISRGSLLVRFRLDIGTRHRRSPPRGRMIEIYGPES